MTEQSVDELLSQRVADASHDMIVAAGELTAVQWVGVLAAVCGQVVAFAETQGNVTRKDDPAHTVTAEELMDSIHEGALAMVDDARARAALAELNRREAERNPSDAS